MQDECATTLYRKLHVHLFELPNTVSQTALIVWNFMSIKFHENSPNQQKEAKMQSS